ncbi:MAG: hypothetical protein ACI3XM_02985, partial [Eubacteriales bacterium]
MPIDTLSAIHTSQTNETEDTEASVSSVSYVNAYQVTELASYEEYRNMVSVYVMDGKLYMLEDVRDNNVKRRQVTVYDENAVITETFIAPELELYTQKDYIFYNVYPLPEERFLLVLDRTVFDWVPQPVYQSEYMRMALCIIDRDGSVLAAMNCNTGVINCNVHISTYDDGSIRILLRTGEWLQYYDDKLNLISEITIEQCLNRGYSLTDFGAEFHDLGNGIFEFPHIPSGIRVDMEHGYMQPIGLRVSSDMPHFILYLGYDGNHYLKTSDGLYLNQDGSRPTEILNWIDAGIGFIGANETLFILNASSIFFTKTETVNGRELTRLCHVSISKIPEPDRTVVRILAITAPDDVLEEGIMKFNASQNRYRIALDTISEKEAENPEETIQKRLLYDNETDIFLCQKDWLIAPYYDKDAFLDLNPYFGDNLLGCVKEAFGYGDALYMMPAYMTVEMFTALTETVDGYLTWDALYALTETLGENEVLTSDTGCVEAIRSNGVMDFVDTENKIAYYDTDDFRRMLLYTESMSDYIDEHVGTFRKLFGGSYYPYVITNGTLPARVRAGGIRLLHTEMETLNAYAILKLIYGDKAFSLCGYPSRDGGSAKVSGYGKLAVRADSDALDGCIAFLTYLLSDAVQSSDGMCGIGLPVTHSGLSTLIDKNRFW